MRTAENGDLISKVKKGGAERLKDELKQKLELETNAKGPLGKINTYHHQRY